MYVSPRSCYCKEGPDSFVGSPLIDVLPESVTTSNGITAHMRVRVDDGECQIMYVILLQSSQSACSKAWISNAKASSSGSCGRRVGRPAELLFEIRLVVTIVLFQPAGALLLYVLQSVCSLKTTRFLTYNDKDSLREVGYGHSEGGTTWQDLRIHSYMSSHTNPTSHTDSFSLIFLPFLSGTPKKRRSSSCRYSPDTEKHYSEHSIRVGLCNQGAWGECSEFHTRGRCF